MEDYIFNENTKRFEPTSKICSCCGIGTAEPGYCDYVPLFHENDRTNFVVYRNVKYSQIEFGIARCQSCTEIHVNAKQKSVFYSVLLGVLFIYIAVQIHQNVDQLFGFLAGIFSPMFALILGTRIKLKIINDSGTQSVNSYAPNDPFIQQFLIRGWTFTKPTA